MLCFPSEDEVRLRRNPLREVICQIRFPPLLRIVNEYPVDFQERIRQQFPELGTLQEILVQMKPLGDEPPSAKPEPPVYRFLSADGKTTASLGLNFYALSTTAYTHWPEFLELLLFLNQAACDVYGLPYAIRVGLRYINHITFANTGLDNLPDLWGVLRPEITALLRAECWDAPQGMLSQLSLTGEDDEKLNLRSGFFGGEKPNLLLDFDYYSEGRITLDSLPSLCERYHDVIYRAFRWCIQEDRLVVFDPIPVEKGD